MATKTFADVASLQAATDAFTSEQMKTVHADPVEGGGLVLTYPDALATLVGAPMPIARLLAYADAKQMTVLSGLEVIYTLKDGSATLDTMCDTGSITFLNSLGSWVALTAAAASPAPTRTYYNLDGSSEQLTPAQMGEFLGVVGAKVQATFDALALVKSAISASSPSITTTAQIDAAAWPK